MRLGHILSVLVVIMFASYVAIEMGGLDITGEAVSTRLVIVMENASACDKTLVDGWNLMSFPCLSDDAPVNLFLNTLDYESIMHYDPLDTADPWKTYNPNLPSWAVQDLSSVSRRKGYWVNVNDGTTFRINGTLATPTLTDLYPGWNMVGYPIRENRKVNDTFKDLPPNYDYVYMYMPEDSDPWKEYTWNTSLVSDQDLNYTLYYYGYWIYMLNPDTLVIG